MRRSLRFAARMTTRKANRCRTLLAPPRYAIAACPALAGTGVQFKHRGCRRPQGLGVCRLDRTYRRDAALPSRLNRRPMLPRIQAQKKLSRRVYGQGATSLRHHRNDAETTGQRTRLPRYFPFSRSGQRFRRLRNRPGRRLSGRGSHRRWRSGSRSGLLEGGTPPVDRRRRGQRTARQVLAAHLRHRSGRGYGG